MMTLVFDSIDSNLGFYSVNEFDRVRRFGTGLGRFRGMYGIRRHTIALDSPFT